MKADEKKKIILTIEGYGEYYRVNKDLISAIINYPKFFECSGSSKPHLHHYGEGGLARHTLDVVELCINNAEHYNIRGNSLNIEILILAALWHDIGKIWDYQSFVNAKTYKEEWEKTPHARNIHHISRSAIEWSKVAEENEYKYTDEVLHCILSHHGQREYGSPVAPKSKEAWLLHLCDSISARMDDADKCDMIKEDGKK